MKAKITEQWAGGRSWEIEGDEVEIVSLFETWAKAWDVSSLSDEEIKEFMSSADLEDYAFDHDIDEIPIKYAAGNNGSDNNWCIIDEQSTKKAVVKDVNGIKLYKGGVREYMDSFGESFEAIQYWDGSNFQLAIESDEGDGSVKIEFE